MHRSRPLVIAVIAAAVVAATGFSACKEASPAHDNRLLLVGDSIFAGSRDTLDQVLIPAGWDPVVQAQAGTTIEDWSDQIQKAVATAHPNVVVVELGTNDCGTVPCVELAPYIDALMGRLTLAEAVLWLTVQDDALIPTEPDRVNAAIKAAEGRWDNLFVVDMTSLFHGHDEWRSDGTHPNAEGQRQMALLIAHALEPFRPKAT